MRPKCERVVADLRGDVGEIQNDVLTCRDIGCLSHHGRAVDAQHEVARIVAFAASDGGGHRLFSAGIGLAADGECDSCRGDVLWDGHVDGQLQLVVADDGSQFVGIAVKALLPGSLVMRAAHHLDIVGAVAHRAGDAKVVEGATNGFVPCLRLVILAT